MGHERRNRRLSENGCVEVVVPAVCEAVTHDTSFGRRVQAHLDRGSCQEYACLRLVGFLGRVLTGIGNDGRRHQCLWVPSVDRRDSVCSHHARRRRQDRRCIPFSSLSGSACSLLSWCNSGPHGGRAHGAGDVRVPTHQPKPRIDGYVVDHPNGDAARISRVRSFHLAQ